MSRNPKSMKSYLALNSTHLNVAELSVTTPTKTITYKHNANNQRVAKLVDGVVVEKYLWTNLTTLLATHDANDTLIQRFEYVDQRMPISMTMGTDKYYLHYDQAGSLRAVTDINHNILKEVTYDTFGNVLSDTNQTLKLPFGFAGGLYDVDTKLTRFGYRDYDAYSGKWTAKDPIGFAGGDSNLYGYVLGDPVNFVDPSGEIAFIAIPLAYWGLGLGAAGATIAAQPYITNWLNNLWNNYNNNICGVGGSNIYWSKGGKQNKKDSGLSGYSDALLDVLYKDPNTPKDLKQRIKREQKARGSRNQQKRRK